MILLEREIPGCHLNYPRPQTFLSNGDRQKQKVFLTFYETSLQICSKRSRGPQGWRSWTAAGLRERGTTAWRPARTRERSVTAAHGRPSCFPGGLTPRLGLERTPKLLRGDTEIGAKSNVGSWLTGQEITSAPQPGFPPQALGVLLGWQNNWMSGSKSKDFKKQANKPLP